MLVPGASFEVYARHRGCSLLGTAVAAGAACARRPRHTDGSVGADVLDRVAIRYEDVEAAASAVAVRRVGEERLQAVAAPITWAMTVVAIYSVDTVLG